MRPRIEQELALLRRYYPGVQHQESGGEDWFWLPDYPFPDGWQIGVKAINKAPVVFKVSAGYPTTAPYGFATTAGINFKGSPPGSPGSPVSPPFDGTWQHFSWSPDGDWQPTADALKGSNLVAWARSFSARLKEGA